MMQASYQRDIDWLESLLNLPHQDYMLGASDRRIFLIRLRNFLKLLANPDYGQKIIHIAGTSGKGSTAKVLQELMTAAGYKTGVYTSPFATTSIEKIQIDNKLMAPSDLHRLLETKIKPALDKYIFRYKTEPPSYFEIFLCLVLLYCQEQKCDYVILETGCGGTHDATNVVRSPVVTAITNVGLDHIDLLGNTKEKIAWDKSGIIKKNSKFLTTEKSPKLLKLFAKRVSQNRAKPVTLKNLSKDYKLSGYFATKKQAENLNLALNILDTLNIGPKRVQSIINNFSMPARQEIIQRKPLVILDGAHNTDKLNNLIEFVSHQKYDKLHLVLGFAENKRYHSVLQKLLGIADNLYLTRFLLAFRKTADLRKLYRESHAIKSKLPISIYFDPHQALTAALKKAKPTDLVLVAGSFYLAGELRKHWVSEEYILSHLKLFKK